MAAPDIPEAARLALRQGRKIEAIKLVRKATGLDLKGAKDAVEAAVAGDPLLRAELQGVVKRPSSAPLWIALILIVGALAWFFALR
ncbi:MAG TPA: ribosomal protein L7/L12 [Candidatus Cybelea sp.]|nr:ribosomal protein L7/L12 [Candidatus Cybelea sp.]